MKTLIRALVLLLIFQTGIAPAAHARSENQILAEIQAPIQLFRAMDKSQWKSADLDLFVDSLKEAMSRSGFSFSYEKTAAQGKWVVQAPEMEGNPGFEVQLANSGVNALGEFNFNVELLQGNEKPDSANAIKGTISFVPGNEKNPELIFSQIAPLVQKFLEQETTKIHSRGKGFLNWLIPSAYANNSAVSRCIIIGLTVIFGIAALIIATPSTQQQDFEKVSALLAISLFIPLLVEGCRDNYGYDSWRKGWFRSRCSNCN